MNLARFQWIALYILSFCSITIISTVTLDQVIRRLDKELELLRESELPTLRGRSRSRSSSKQRQILPLDWTSSNHRPTKLTCGQLYNVGKEGFIKFFPNSKNDECAGSRMLNCTVIMYCDGFVTFAPPSPSEGCQQEFFVMSDGTIGRTAGCDSFSFESIPRKPRNTGTDIYLYYKGKSMDSPCVAVCMEDLNNANWKQKPASKLNKRKNFIGFPMAPDCECGIRQFPFMGRIVGGEETIKHEFPWLAAIVYNFDGYRRIPFCGASLISDMHVLTAAHCFADGDDDPNDFQILLHAHVLDKQPNHNGNQYNEREAAKSPGWDLPKETDKSEGSIRVDIKEIIMHPLFGERNFIYDVAIIVLKKKVNLHSGKVSPICLPYMHETFKFQQDEEMMVSGWGMFKEKAPVLNRVPQKVALPFLNYAKCSSLTKVTHTHMCAAELAGGKDSCTGDSGGPLMYKIDRNKNQYILAGIVSAGVGCARKYVPGIYTDVQEILQWVYYHTVKDTKALWCAR